MKVVVLIVAVVVFCAVVVGGGGVPFGSFDSVLVSVVGVGGGEIEAGSATEFEASSNVTCTVTGGDCEALHAFEEVAFPLPPDLPSCKRSLLFYSTHGPVKFPVLL